MKKLSFSQIRFISFILLLSALLAACVEEVPLENLQSIRISSANSTSANIIPENRPQQFKAEGLFLDGSTADISSQVEWSGGGSIFSVSNDLQTKGQVTPIALGTEQIEVVSGGITGLLEVIVTNANPGSNGELIISEIMNNPLALDDSDGEWFELFNTTENRYSLIGCELSDESGNDGYTIDKDIIIEANEYLVFANSSMAVANTDVIYNNFVLDNIGSDEIILTCNKKLIDWVQFDDGLTFPSVEGTSLNLDPLLLDAVSNNDGVNWCAASSLYSSDYGTPGTINSACIISDPAPIEITISPAEISLLDGEEIQFSGDVTGTTDTGVSWSLLEKTEGILTTTGLFTAPSTNSSYHVRVSSDADNSKTATATVEVSTIGLTISPIKTIIKNNGEQQFTAEVTGTENSAVNWHTTGGVISTTGLFTAPALAGEYTVTATSQADPRKSISTTIEVSNPIELTLTATSINLFDGETFQLTSILKNIANNKVSWFVEGVGSGIVSNDGLYTAPLTPGVYKVSVASIDNPSITSEIEVIVSLIEMTLSTNAAGVPAGSSLLFNAIILGHENDEVLWSSSGGTINENGLFTAPVTAGTYTITATSAADSRKSATSTITVTQPVELSVSVFPTNLSIYEGKTIQFESAVTNAADKTTTWSIITPATGSNTGTISSAGFYTAPLIPGTYQIAAISNEEKSKSAVATITVEKITLEISRNSLTLAPNELFNFSVLQNGSATSDIIWSTTGGTVSATGLFTAPSEEGNYIVTATSTLDNRKSATAAILVEKPPLISVTISPENISLFDLQEVSFKSTITGTSNKNVTWSVGPGFNTIGQNGFYQAPVTGGVFQVKVTSDEDPSKFATATVTVSVVEVTVAPNNTTPLSWNTQRQFSANVTGHESSAVVWSTTGGLIDATGLYTAPSAPGIYKITATSVADSRKSSSVNVTVTGESDAITVNINNSHNRHIFDEVSTQLSATVSGTENRAVTWHIVETDGGTITQKGLYTSPAKAGTFQIVATSVEDPTKFASTSIRVSKISVSLSAKTTTVVVRQRLPLDLLITGAIEIAEVYWMTDNGGVDGYRRQYVAPGIPGTYTVTAYNIEDPRKFASLEIEVIDDAYYEFTDAPDGDTFVIHLTDAEKINQANNILHNGETLGIMGTIIKEPATFNPNWSYQLAPESILFFEMAVEVCDASIQYVEDNLADVGGEFLPANIWCPWGSALTKKVYP